VGLYATGCGCSLPIPGRPGATIVSGQEFQNRYSRDRNLTGRADYAGRLGSYHYLDIYDIGCGDWAMYRYSIRAHKNELPRNFPQEPQNPLRKSFAPSFPNSQPTPSAWRTEHQCIGCGYLLVGNVSGICPECGTPKPTPESAP
jgi:hypothetical protein